jgi:uncharacterized protein
VDEKKALALLEKYGKGSPGYAIILNHCKAVQKLSLEWARKIKANGYKVDLDFVRTAALLHDIGRFGYPPFSTDKIRHGIEGARILRNEGYPKHARLAERHIGAGITKEDIKKQDLPLPMKDYVPKTAEEKIIACADNLFHGDKKMDIGWSLREIEGEVDKEHAERALKLYKEIQKMLKEKAL